MIGQVIQRMLLSSVEVSRCTIQHTYMTILPPLSLWVYLILAYTEKNFAGIQQSTLLYQQNFFLVNGTFTSEPFEWLETMYPPQIVYRVTNGARNSKHITAYYITYVCIILRIWKSFVTNIIKQGFSQNLSAIQMWRVYTHALCLEHVLRCCKYNEPSQVTTGFPNSSHFNLELVSFFINTCFISCIHLMKFKMVETIRGLIFFMKRFT